jgi:small acid-soluble spore protein P (minor)
MPKDIPQPVNPPTGQQNQEENRGVQEPLSGSKQVKNRNHSNRRYGEGS